MHVDIRLNGRKSKIKYFIGEIPLSPSNSKTKKRRLFGSSPRPTTARAEVEYANYYTGNFYPDSAAVLAPNDLIFESPLLITRTIGVADNTPISSTEPNLSSLTTTSLSSRRIEQLYQSLRRTFDEV